MTRHIITDYELNEIILAAGDEVRASFGKGNPEKAEARLYRFEQIVEAREIPENVLGFYIIDNDGNPKCLEIPK